MPARPPSDSTRFFNIENVPAKKLDALLYETEIEGHRLIHLIADRVGATNTYTYTVFFERASG